MGEETQTGGKQFQDGYQDVPIVIRKDNFFWLTKE